MQPTSAVKVVDKATKLRMLGEIGGNDYMREYRSMWLDV